MDERKPLNLDYFRKPPTGLGFFIAKGLAGSFSAIPGMAFVYETLGCLENKIKQRQEAGLASSALSDRLLHARNLIMTTPFHLGFGPGQSLAVATLASKLIKQGFRPEDCAVTVDGFDNLTKRNLEELMIGYVKGGSVKDYERTFAVSSCEEAEVDIGGDNATKERIAAHHVGFHFSATFNHDWFEDSDFPFFGPDALAQMTLDEFNRKYYNMEFNSVIAIASQMKTGWASDALAGMLVKRLCHEKMEKICNAFRSFKELCSKKTGGGYSVTNTVALTEYIKNNIFVPERLCSVVYAIESLGYVSCNHRHPSLEASSLLLNLCADEKTRYLHPELPWAAFVSLREMCDNHVRNKPRTLEIAESCKNCKEGPRIVEIAKEILKKKD